MKKGLPYLSNELFWEAMKEGQGTSLLTFPPLLPEVVARYRLDMSSEDRTEEKDANHDAKRQRSTSNTPRNDIVRDWAPRAYDNVMGIGPGGSSSLKVSPQSVPNNSGVDKGSRGCGSASLLEAIPAACASQEVIDSLRIGLFPRHNFRVREPVANHEQSPGSSEQTSKKHSLLFTCSSRNHSARSVRAHRSSNIQFQGGDQHQMIIGSHIVFGLVTISTSNIGIM